VKASLPYDLKVSLDKRKEREGRDYSLMQHHKKHAYKTTIRLLMMYTQ